MAKQISKQQFGTTSTTSGPGPASNKPQKLRVVAVRPKAPWAAEIALEADRGSFKVAMSIDEGEPRFRASLFDFGDPMPVCEVGLTAPEILALHDLYGYFAEYIKQWVLHRGEGPKQLQ